MLVLTGAALALGGCREADRPVAAVAVDPAVEIAEAARKACRAAQRRAFLAYYETRREEDLKNATAAGAVELAGQDLAEARKEARAATDDFLAALAELRAAEWKAGEKTPQADALFEFGGYGVEIAQRAVWEAEARPFGPMQEKLFDEHLRISFKIRLGEVLAGGYRME